MLLEFGDKKRFGSFRVEKRKRGLEVLRLKREKERDFGLLREREGE